MGQTWDDLLFAHWPLPVASLRPLVPRELPLDEFDGCAWLGITPFRLTGLRVRGVPPLPRLSDFPELNVRTYVTLGGKPGIFFFSLDAARRYAVVAARRLYHLPYFHARMRARTTARGVDYESTRADRRGHDARLTGTYAGDGTPRPAAPSSLEYFLAERYCLYTLDPSRRVLRAEIHHPPWPLERAEAELRVNTMPPPGVRLPETTPLLHFARRQDVLIWTPDAVA